MAIVHCAACGARVSSLSQQCGGCGAAVRGTSSGSIEPRKRRVPGTGLIAQSIAAMLVFIAGALLFVRGSGSAMAAYALPLMLLGGCWYLVVRALLWWRSR